ncbi:DUF423 domain-containing protein [Thalassotalea aquiviva]|uniref:DUF423 domain-containing protein n=1 Tax=Thalassotalea aquiviva TaxID=3242415 RepID=UPI00352BC978
MASVTFLQLFSGFCGAISVLAYAWLSHAQHGLVSKQIMSLETALLFAFIHLLAIFIVVLLYLQTRVKQYLLSGYLFAFGIIGFSGVIFLKTFLISGLGIITPIGGMAFAFGWLILGLASNKFKQSTQA